MLRIKKIQSKLEKNNIDALFVSNLKNIAYLSNFVGSNAKLLICKKDVFLITDSRYLRSAKQQINKKVKIYNQADGLIPLMKNIKRLGFEDKNLTYYDYLSLKKTLKSVNLLPKSGIIEYMRIFKDENEIKTIKKAVSIANKSFLDFTKIIKLGDSEKELDWILYKISRDNLADKFSFSPIISFSENTANVHHRKSDRKLKRGDSVLVDFGISYKGYKTDMTRVFYTAKPSKIEQKMYSTVLKANQEAIKFVKLGVKASEIDAVARNIIEESGYGEYFLHSTGHGVGLDIHEEPFISSQASRDFIIEKAMVFTIEPGVYLNNVGGVRIEDMIYINQKGEVEVLTGDVSKDIKILDL